MELKTGRVCCDTKPARRGVKTCEQQRKPDCVNQLVPVMFTSIFNNAFDVQAIFGGFAGSCVMHGIKRGLFSNEAGVGSAPNAAASAAVSHPVKQGLVQMLSVFIDTILICSANSVHASLFRRRADF